MKMLQWSAMTCDNLRGLDMPSMERRGHVRMIGNTAAMET